MKISIAENPNNPSRYWLMNADTGKKITTVYPYQLQRGLTLGGDDPDPAWVVILKVRLGVPLTRNKVVEELAKITDAEKFASQFGLTRKELIGE